jgi:hypothetical protein
VHSAILASTLNELYGRDHTVCCFDLLTSTNQKVAEKFARFIEVQWGDILKPTDVTKAFDGIDVVLHLAVIIPGSHY